MSTGYALARFKHRALVSIEERQRHAKIRDHRVVVGPREPPVTEADLDVGNRLPLLDGDTGFASYDLRIGPS